MENTFVDFGTTLEGKINIGIRKSDLIPDLFTEKGGYKGYLVRNEKISKDFPPEEKAKFKQNKLSLLFYNLGVDIFLAYDLFESYKSFYRIISNYF